MLFVPRQSKICVLADCLVSVCLYTTHSI